MMKKKGFTLIELLIVVIIIGILASIALPQFTKTVLKAKSSEAVIQLSAIRSSMERHWAEGVAGGEYVKVSEAGTELDVDIPTTTDWAYTIADAHETGVPVAQDYLITATEEVDTTWVAIDQDGTIYRSPNLGGPAIPV